MFRCDHCGAIFDDLLYEPMENDTGYRAAVCPNCQHEDYTEVWACTECGDIFEENCLTNGICNKCAAEMATVKMAKAYGEWISDGRNFYSVNDFLVYCLDAGEADGILWKYIAEHFSYEELTDMAKKYCLEDKYTFTEFAAEERKGA